MKTLIAIPCMDMMHTAFVQDLMKLDMHPLGQVSIRFRPNSLIYDARNLLALEAIQDGYDQILWLDSDMSFPTHMTASFTEALNLTHADMVTGIYFKRKLPTEPVLYKSISPPKPDSDGIPRNQIEVYTDFPHDTVFPVAGCGFGTVLMRTDLCKRIFDKIGVAFTPIPWGGEDIAFCYRANTINARIVCDSRVHISHIGNYLYGEKDYTTQEDKPDA